MRALPVELSTGRTVPEILRSVINVFRDMGLCLFFWNIFKQSITERTSYETDRAGVLPVFGKQVKDLNDLFQLCECIILFKQQEFFHPSSLNKAGVPGKQHPLFFARDFNKESVLYMGGVICIETKQPQPPGQAAKHRVSYESHESWVKSFYIITLN